MNEESIDESFPTDEEIARVFSELIQHPAYLKIKAQRIAEDKMSVQVTDATFDEEVLKSELPVLVDFWAAWCGPCKMIAPILEQLAVKFDGRLKIAKVDVDDNPRIPEIYKIKSIPTLILFKNGEIVDKCVGFADQAYLEQLLQDTFGL